MSYIFWKACPRPFHLTKKYLPTFPLTYQPTYIPPLIEDKSWRLVTFQTFDRSDEAPWPDQKQKNTLKERFQRLHQGGVNWAQTLSTHLLHLLSFTSSLGPRGPLGTPLFVCLFVDKTNPHQLYTLQLYESSEDHCHWTIYFLKADVTNHPLTPQPLILTPSTDCIKAGVTWVDVCEQICLLMMHC